MSQPKEAIKAAKLAWTDLEHDFLAACSKVNVPYDWVDRALGRTPRSAVTHARSTGIPASQWKGRLSYNQARRARAKFVIVRARFAKKGMKLK